MPKNNFGSIILFTTFVETITQMATKKKVEPEYESIKLPKNTVALLRRIKDVTGISIISFAEKAIQYKALDLPQAVKDEIKILKFLK